MLRQKLLVLPALAATLLALLLSPPAYVAAQSNVLKFGLYTIAPNPTAFANM